MFDVRLYPLVSQIGSIMEKEEWLKRYKARMIERGLSEKDAQAITDVTANDEYCGEDDPEDSADDELSYWASDG
jgi:hypothetical protein